MTKQPSYLSEDGADVLVRVKAVPGAKSDRIVGALGDRLKIRIAAPPEGGKANRAICELIAETLGVKSASVVVERGHASAEKTVRISGVSMANVLEKIGRVVQNGD